MRLLVKSILRHSYRGVQMNAKRKTRLRSTSKAELVKINASKMDGTRAVGANQAVEQITMMVTTIRREFAHSSRNLGKLLNGKQIHKKKKRELNFLSRYKSEYATNPLLIIILSRIYQTDQTSSFSFILPSSFFLLPPLYILFWFIKSSNSE